MTDYHTTITTAELPDAVHEALLASLRELFPDAKGGEAWQFSQSPPAWVEIIANLTTWETVLKIGATAYVAQLAKRLADEHWENRARYRKEVITALGNTLDRLRQFVGYLAEAAGKIRRRLGVRMGIPGPGGESVWVSVALESEEELLEATALFIDYLQGIAQAVETIQDEHGEPLPPGIRCCLLQDGFRLIWHDQEMRPCQQVFEPNGSPRTTCLFAETEED